ncbi:HepT-like ribonuclease domain-containing protein [Methanosarcina sp. Kolksee]|uniref:HepT-like ribonuclease domain-containing protein n=1 Tax=Methanosarcina sp. Kolksee TaxID=1434099 RepID=UPI000A63171F|nr:HepT-like ribonuclease domain-containing protein [Methanosarcina sp. Kolksee]
MEKLFPIDGRVKVRNILVHVYEEVDLDILRKLLAENLRDFDIFAFYAAEYAAKLAE